MAREWDVVVVGGGLAGRMAALAATDGGASVHVVSESEDALRHSSGLFDLLGYEPGTESPLSEPFGHLAKLPDEHPYSVLGEPTIRSAVRRFDAAVGASFGGLSSERNGLVVGPLGISLVAHGLPETVEPGLLSRDEAVRLVDIDPLQDFDAEIAATNLERTGLATDIETGTIDLGEAVLPETDRLDVAHRLDREVSAAPADRTLLPLLSDALLEVSRGYERIGIPAVLGVDRTTAVYEAVDSRIDATLFEIPTGPPSVLGIRLDRDLDAAIDRTGVLVTAGLRVVDYRADGDRIAAVALDRDGATEWVRGRQFVLATGGFVGGGLHAMETDLVEPVFDCPVRGPSDVKNRTATGPFETQPFATAGLAVDDGLRPLEADDSPCFSNLRAAGDVIGGFDPVAEGSAAGTATATGYAAGTWAAREGSS